MPLQDQEFDDAISDDDTTTVDEGLARMMMIMMGKHAATVGNMLRKRADLTNSICRLARHIPRCVLEDVIENYIRNREDNKTMNSLSDRIISISSIECVNVSDAVRESSMDNGTPATDEEIVELPILDSSNTLYQIETEGMDGALTSEELMEATEPRSRPYVNYHQCALLFVDISGFTKISQTLELEPLSEVFNNYFEMIVREVTNYGGDIIKFSGNAIFAEWRVDKTADKIRSRTVPTLSEAVTIAAICGTRIASVCGDVPIYAPVKGLNEEAGIKSIIGKLRVHCGLGAGTVAAIHVGNDTTRREFLVVGNPIDQATAACTSAAHGEVAASREALSYLAQICSLSKEIHSSNDQCATIIASHDQRNFQPHDQLDFKASHRENSTDLVDAITVSCESLEINDLKDLRMLLALYVHPVISRDEIANSNFHLNAHYTSQDYHKAEAELRTIYTIFIMPQFNTKLTGNTKKDKIMFRLLNSTFLIVTRELEKYRGHLRQFIMDDKGVILIATFGLRGSACPNMVSERALPCTTSVSNALQMEAGVECRIGATLGRAYCGIVGGISRHEFAVLGPSINLSASLACSSQNPSILVDNNVRLKANKSFSFNALQPVKAKGYANLVPIFEPISANEKTWGKALRDFVGRRKEIDAILQLARQVAYSNDNANFIFIQAESGAGKTSLVIRALSQVKKMAIAARKHLIVVRNLSNDGDRMIPFSMFQACFKGILNEVKGARGEVSSDLSCSLPDSQSGSNDFSQSSANSRLRGGSSVTSGSSQCSRKYEPCSDSSSAACSTSMDRLAFLVNELQAPPEFADIVGGHILGLRGKSNISSHAKNRSGSLDAIVDFMARAFIRCTSHAGLVVLALDDIHHLDELSWKIVEKIFQWGKNILIIGASRPLKSCKLEVDPAFWSNLNNQHSKELRFTSFFLSSLSDVEIRDLIAQKLGARAQDVDKNFYADLHFRSGGMPHFATQIIENIKKKRIVDFLPDGKIGWRTNLESEETTSLNFATAGELIVHRIDSLDTFVRQLLYICAVFGREFELSDVTTVCRGWLMIEEGYEESYIRIAHALNDAVSEGIIDEVYEGGQDQKHGELDEELEDDDEALEASEIEKLKHYNVQYRFHHDTWRENILQQLLDSRKKEIHSIIADSLEASMNEGDMNTDYCFMVKLFNHRKASGNTLKVSSLALAIGESFVNIFLNNQAIHIYDEALAMWVLIPDDDILDTVAGFPLKVLQSIDQQDLKIIVALHIAKAQCLTNVLRHKDGVQVYNDALSIIKNTPSSAAIVDRSYSFPVFSGLFFLLKMGKIELDDECSYEQELVEMFVLETKLHGDPVHYGRALGMKAEHFARLGKFSDALDVFNVLEKIYDVEKHSAAICKAYGSDRCAQVFSLSVTWNLLLGYERKARETCDFVLDHLVEKMDLRNVHNTLMILYPILFVMKDWGEAKRMRTLLSDMVVTPFYEHFGEGGSTPLIFLYKPLDILLEVCEKEDISDLVGTVDWVLKEGNGLFGDFIDRTMGTSGRTGASITAEICLCLARAVEDNQKKRQLVAKGTALARRSNIICLRDPKMPFAHAQTAPVLTALEEMVAELDVPEGMISQKAFDYN